eukprot:9476133-Pyramimonas_sp.AAC.1
MVHTRIARQDTDGMVHTHIARQDTDGMVHTRIARQDTDSMVHTSPPACDQVRAGGRARGIPEVS